MAIASEDYEEMNSDIAMILKISVPSREQVLLQLQNFWKPL